MAAIDQVVSADQGPIRVHGDQTTPSNSSIGGRTGYAKGSGQCDRAGDATVAREPAGRIRVVVHLHCPRLTVVWPIADWVGAMFLGASVARPPAPDLIVRPALRGRCRRRGARLLRECRRPQARRGGRPRNHRRRGARRRDGQARRPRWDGRPGCGTGPTRVPGNQWPVDSCPGGGGRTRDCPTWRLRPGGCRLASLSCSARWQATSAC